MAMTKDAKTGIWKEKNCLSCTNCDFEADTKSYFCVHKQVYLDKIYACFAFNRKPKAKKIKHAEMPLFDENVPKIETTGYGR